MSDADGDLSDADGDLSDADGNMSDGDGDTVFEDADRDSSDDDDALYFTAPEELDVSEASKPDIGSEGWLSLDSYSFVVLTCQYSTT